MSLKRSTKVVKTKEIGEIPHCSLVHFDESVGTEHSCSSGDSVTDSSDTSAVSPFFMGSELGVPFRHRYGCVVPEHCFPPPSSQMILLSD
jgi:hypothetical protein